MKFEKYIHHEDLIQDVLENISDNNEYKDSLTFAFLEKNLKILKESKDNNDPNSINYLFSKEYIIKSKAAYQTPFKRQDVSSPSRSRFMVSFNFDI